MMPAITHVDGVKMIRDCGSLAVVFRCADSGEYWLFFPVELARSTDGVLKRRGYGAPRILGRGEPSREFPLSWEHALAYLDQVRGFALDERSRHWWSAMRQVARSAGALPMEVPRLFDGSV